MLKPVTEKLVRLNSFIERTARNVRTLERRKKELEQSLRTTVQTFISENWEVLRTIRGNINQKVVARRADVTQSYVSSVETGDASRIGDEALIRILTVYAEMEDGNARSSGLCEESSVEVLAGRGQS